jgi:hypothetical protein
LKCHYLINESQCKQEFSYHRRECFLISWLPTEAGDEENGVKVCAARQLNSVFSETSRAVRRALFEILLGVEAYREHAFYRSGRNGMTSVFIQIAWSMEPTQKMTRLANCGPTFYFADQISITKVAVRFHCACSRSKSKFFFPPLSARATSLPWLSRAPGNRPAHSAFL